MKNHSLILNEILLMYNQKLFQMNYLQFKQGKQQNTI